MASSLAASNGAARIVASVEANAPGGFSRQTGGTGQILADSLRFFGERRIVAR
jgi:hypothetical protein